jgi:hypothetical protein
MSARIDDLLPSAKAQQEKLALAEAAKAAEEERRHAAAEAEKQHLLAVFSNPSGISDEEAVRRGAAIIQRAVNNGLTEVQVYRFPNQMCTDRGRAINQMEPGWESTLTGVPKEIYQVWQKYFRPRGYKLRVEVVEWPGGMPGDIGMTLSWA